MLILSAGSADSAAAPKAMCVTSEMTTCCAPRRSHGAWALLAALMVRTVGALAVIGAQQKCPVDEYGRQIRPAQTPVSPAAPEPVPGLRRPIARCRPGAPSGGGAQVQRLLQEHQVQPTPELASDLRQPTGLREPQPLVHPQ